MKRALAIRVYPITQRFQKKTQHIVDFRVTPDRRGTFCAGQRLVDDIDIDP